ncbi:NADH-quinone oxidoreductase subunit NuoF [Salisaeta longa]|uniref:NADH-quinone oxidoreductase subunit NuoF n=1 Tax=Salisaeta longa TaxID=503170 RepID=UPI0003B66F9F|nr:NADH-quinone oxidoreductase subunit NuoF [Salisaeta longa]
MEATNGAQSKAGDWRNYQRILLPPVKDLHRLDVYEDEGGYEVLRDVLTDADTTPGDVTETVKEANLRGRGGAGFSAGMKWSFMPEPDDRPRYLACNADESEPGTFKDRQIMEYNPHLLYEGILIAGYAMSIDVCYIYVRGEYADWIQHMERELEKAYAAGYVGQNIMDTGFDMEIVIHKGAGAYICGEETSLLNSLEGKRGYPRYKPPFPAQKGAWDSPTTINNVETLAHVPHIMKNGAEWFGNIGAEGHPGPTIYGIAGHVNRPGAYEYPTGMLITDLIYEVAGGMQQDKGVKAVIPGGSSVPPLRGDSIEGVTMDAESLREAGSMMGTAGMLILNEDTDMVSWLRRVTHFYQHESCGQCTPCREGTGWLEQLVTRIDEGEGRLRDLDLLLDLCDQMEGRTICAFADAAAWPVRNTIQRFREDFEAKCKPSHVTAA